MKNGWRDAMRNAAVSGSIAALTSTAALMAAGRRETGSALAPTNAVSHWIWGDRAARHDEPSARYTLVGYTIHHLASVFWAVVYQRLLGRSADRGVPGRAVAGGLAVAALACFVDYRLTPRRLQPGYEMRLSRPALAGVYTAFGLGLALGAIVNARARRGARHRA
jgi:hypothetical protein